MQNPFITPLRSSKSKIKKKVGLFSRQDHLSSLSCLANYSGWYQQDTYRETTSVGSAAPKPFAMQRFPKFPKHLQSSAKSPHVAQNLRKPFMFHFLSQWKKRIDYKITFWWMISLPNSQTQYGKGLATPWIKCICISLLVQKHFYILYWTARSKLGENIQVKSQSNIAPHF